MEWSKTMFILSDIVDVKFPQIASSDIWLENTISIRVLEWPVILVGCKVK